jgi:hypothetical protein
MRIKQGVEATRMIKSRALACKTGCSVCIACARLQYMMWIMCGYRGIGNVSMESCICILMHTYAYYTCVYTSIQANKFVFCLVWALSDGFNCLTDDRGMKKSCSVTSKVSNGHEPSFRWTCILDDLNLCESDPSLQKFFSKKEHAREEYWKLGWAEKNQTVSQENWLGPKKIEPTDPPFFHDGHELCQDDCADSDSEARRICSKLGSGDSSDSLIRASQHSIPSTFEAYSFCRSIREKADGWRCVLKTVGLVTRLGKSGTSMLNITSIGFV